MTAQGGAYTEDEYTLNVGCVPTLVDFRSPNEYDDSITLYYGDPLLNAAKIYEIEPFEAYSSSSMPAGLDCSILKYEIVATSAGTYKYPEELEIDPELATPATGEHPIMLGECDSGESPCNELSLVSTNIIESFTF